MTKLPFQLRVHYPHSSEHGQAASWDHILAAVRRGVESGTIKGEVVMGCTAHDMYDHDNCELRQYLCIPISDGGEDRP